MKLSFQADRDPEENSRMFLLARQTLVQGAVKERLIGDDDLAQAVEVAPFLFKLAGQLRDDLYDYHVQIDKQLQFPIIRSCLCYSFAKGAEIAYLWHHSLHGKIEFTYDPDDALAGRAGARVTDEFAGQISLGMLLMENVFCDFQDALVAARKEPRAAGNRWLADFIACGIYSSGEIGMDFGMNLLGYR